MGYETNKMKGGIPILSKGKSPGLLINKSQQSVEKFFFDINTELISTYLHSSGTKVQIIFVDGKYSETIHGIDEIADSRDYWIVMAAIAERIKELEGSFEKKPQI
jgi:hypothetical protein